MFREWNYAIDMHARFHEISFNRIMNIVDDDIVAFKGDVHCALCIAR